MSAPTPTSDKTLWPDGHKAALVIGVDDVHPESSEDGCDCGGDMENGVLGSLLRLADEFQVKFTLFITPQWIYLPQSGLLRYLHSKKLPVQNTLRKAITHTLWKTWPKDKFRIDSESHREWASFIRREVEGGRFSVGIHGLYHFWNGWHPTQEFMKLTLEEASQRISKAKQLFKNSGIPYTPVFAPPGWKVTANLERALLREQIPCIAGSGGEPGIKEVSLIYPQRLESGLINIPRNWVPGCNSTNEAEDTIKKGGLIGIHMHIHDGYHGETIQSGLNSKALECCKTLLKYLEEKYEGKIWYTTFNEISQWCKGKLALV
jgi:peptidoglycan/xylan/chitin deacetylase (PgdA/CDA1 family)